MCHTRQIVGHLKTCAAFKCDKLSSLVLDEADRLLDLGFERQLREIAPFSLSAPQAPKTIPEISTKPSSHQPL